MAKRVQKTTKSPEDYKESGRLQRVRKTTKSPEDYQSQEDYKKREEPQDYKGPRKPRDSGSPQESGSPQGSGSLQESKMTAKSQESRISRVWKTGITQELKSRRITPNIAIFPSARGGEKEKGKRLQSQSMVKRSDDSSFLVLHP
jgi:hypothetical protein